MKNLEVIFYVPNLINYFRIFLMILMVYNLKKRPITTFILCISSGFLDSIDGRIARHLNQTSRIGALFDVTMDRLTNLAQYFTLGALYPKYSTVFFLVGSNQILKDFFYFTLENYVLTLKIKYFTDKNSLPNNTLNIINQPIYERVDTISSFSNVYELYKYFVEPFFWYSSDLFYWLIYFKAFIPQNLNTINGNGNNNNSNKNKHHKFNILAHFLGIFKNFSNDFHSGTETLSLFAEEYLLYKLNLKCLKSSQIQIFFCILMNICLIGAFMKFYLNFKAAVSFFIKFLLLTIS